MSREPGGRFRGGGQARRDRWFGLEERPDFEAFRRWWHRVGKEEAGGRDLEGREQAFAEYEAWITSGRNRVRS
ncbi:hypothetical protein Q8W71_18915 [Methylobacterium sp. NEAU 140]|uniref:hypothetical protein n=1 Tax=Methylobacterium sp. NEAU 140 TaxID=3064945 RepID=UPI0027343534|nr:hypothetical protein [Methylobacterium sp. NEAU 140]MDP4024703.1 hypothetical protein [Methylobacterium sp. NEAU 140]